jgi:hypothetical protein
MSTSLLKQIADLERRSLAELQDRWRQLVGTEPPRYAREFMVKRLAYRLQELAHGGLTQDTRDRMNQLLDDAGYNELGGLRAGARPRAHRESPVVGTRLVREWDGRRHEVTVVQGGFEFEGQRYRSLSAIAKVVTGTHWNGRAFFGLPPRGTRRKASR